MAVSKALFLLFAWRSPPATGPVQRRERKNMYSAVSFRFHPEPGPGRFTRRRFICDLFNSVPLLQWKLHQLEAIWTRSSLFIVAKQCRSRVHMELRCSQWLTRARSRAPPHRVLLRGRRARAPCPNRRTPPYPPPPMEIGFWERALLHWGKCQWKSFLGVKWSPGTRGLQDKN